MSVLVTPDLILKQADGSGRIDVDKITLRAIEMGADPTLVWRTEADQTILHPIQIAPPIR